MELFQKMPQSEVNIGTIGHVDHGKTTLTQALTGKWADTHSDELKRGITIKLGYADAVFYKCPKCKAPHNYSPKPVCPKCKSAAQASRRVSIVDAPGHETLMATVIAASSIIDGALFVIAANEECPQPQTVEHLAVLEAAGIKNVVVVQNKVDLVSREQALVHYQQVKAFLKGSSYENAPIIPTVANHGTNLDAVIGAIESTIPTPARDLDAEPIMLVARSFDVNKPGSSIEGLHGGVVGGSIVRGKFKAGDEIEISPGALRHHKKSNKDAYEKIVTKISSLFVGNERVEEAIPGGLVGIGTEIDPSLSHADSLVGCVVARVGKIPEPVSELVIEVSPLSRVIEHFSPGYLPNEPLVLGIGTATTVGFVTSQRKKLLTLALKKPVVANSGDKVAVMRRANNRWRLFGTAKIA